MHMARHSSPHFMRRCINSVTERVELKVSEIWNCASNKYFINRANKAIWSRRCCSSLMSFWCKWIKMLEKNLKRLKRKSYQQRSCELLNLKQTPFVVREICRLNPTLSCLLIKVKLGRSTLAMLYAINEFRFELFFLAFTHSHRNLINRKRLDIWFRCRGLFEIQPSQLSRERGRDRKSFSL